MLKRMGEWEKEQEKGRRERGRGVEASSHSPFPSLGRIGLT